MRTYGPRLLGVLAFVLMLHISFGTCFGQGTAFTYQGQLTAGGQPANGSYDMEFSLYNAVTNGTQVGSTVTNLATSVSNGVFNVIVDFGLPPYNGQALWLQIAVSPAGSNTFAALSPLQPLTSTPYAVQSLNAGTAANVTGPIALAQLPAGVVINGTTNVTLGGTFSGNGVGLTNVRVSASSITGGKLAASLLPTNVVLNGPSGVALSGTFSGTFSGNGSALSNLNAAQLAGTINPSVLPTNVLTVNSITQTVSFTTAGVYPLTTPLGATQMVVKLWGAGGGGYDQGTSGIISPGGGGAFVQKTIALSGQSTYYIVVGQGGDYNANDRGGRGSGDAAGGDSGHYGEGGQASSLFYFTNNSYIMQAVAGGGGGGGYFGPGGGGGNPGETGDSWLGSGGSGGYNGAGGSAGGVNYDPGEPGANYNTNATTTGMSSLSLAGGNGGTGYSSDVNTGGGGGGGYGGGGGGGATQYGNGGGGGGSYGDVIIAGGANFVQTADSSPAGNESDPNYISPQGVGGNAPSGSAGADGLVVVIFTVPETTVPGLINAAGFYGNGSGLAGVNAATAATASNVVSGISLTNAILNGTVAFPPQSIPVSALPSNAVVTRVNFQTNIYSSSGTFTFTIPMGVTGMVAKLWGAGGGGSQVATGGAGAFVQKTLPVIPGQTYTVVVGQRGNFNNSNLGGSGSGDAAGGSPTFGTSSKAGQGGQGTSLFYTGTNYVVEAVAGGGGGGGYGGVGNGGPYGGAGGNPGQAGGNSASPQPIGAAGGNNGNGGSPGSGANSTGGTGGNYSANAATTGISSLGQAGGSGGFGASSAGGGGGGYGGGGGGGNDNFADAGGGGGGGSLGDIVVAGTNNAPGNTGDPSYVSGSGVGGTFSAAGTDGSAVIILQSAVTTIPGNVVAAAIIGNQMVVNGNLGVNTNDPTANVSIAGVTNYNTGLKLTGSSPNGAGMAINNTSSGGHQYALISTGNANSTGPGSFGLFDDTLSGWRFVVSPSGNIGLGGVINPGLNTLQINPPYESASGYALEANNLQYGANIQINQPSGGGGIGLVVDNAANGDANTHLLWLRNNAATSPQTVMDVRAGTAVTINVTYPLMVGGAYCDGSTWHNASDRNIKHDVTPIDPLQILDKLAAMPINEWKYNAETNNSEHLGPMAQDFMAAFHLGTDDKSIGTLDESGVALAAIQGVNQKLETANQKLGAEVKALKAQNQDLQNRLDELERFVHQTRESKPAAHLDE